MESDLIQKIENQKKVIEELTAENEQLFQQFNHLMVRNGKLLKRIDDMQQIIDSMHLRIEESQLINDNMLKINDGLRNKNDNLSGSIGNNSPINDTIWQQIDQMQRRIDELNLRNDILQQRTTMLNSGLAPMPFPEAPAKSPTDIYEWKLLELWKSYPGQKAKNEPNLRKQARMLLRLYEEKSLNAEELFKKTGVNGVTGARYVSVLKQFNLIEYKGARKKGKYFITQKGTELIETAKQEKEISLELLTDVPLRLGTENADGL